MQYVNNKSMEMESARMMVKFSDLSIVVDGQIDPTYADFIVMSWVQGYGAPAH